MFFSDLFGVVFAPSLTDDDGTADHVADTWFQLDLMNNLEWHVRPRCFEHTQ